MRNRILYSRIVMLYGSASAFADKLGVTRSFVSQKLTGAKRFTKNDITKWGAALEISVDEYENFFPDYFAALREKEVFT